MTKISRKKIYNFSVIIEKDERGYYIGKVPALRSCYTQAKNLPELYKRLEEVVALCLEVEKEIFQKRVKQNKFIGVQQLEFSR
jgi:predicted RNase H-like HicB family nuclease